ncbi:diguanylate cyclase [Spirochaetota bacterium]
MSYKTSIDTDKLFANIGKLITSSLDLNVILRGIMKEIQIYFDPQNWSLMRYDHTSQELLFVIIEGISYENVKDIKLKVGEGIAGNVIKTGKSIFVPDTKKDSRFTDKVDKITGFKTESIIAVPIKTEDKIFGVIEIVNRAQEGAFTEAHHLVLKTIADFSAIAFDNSRVYNKVIKKSEIDHLTGLYNSAKLNSVIDEYSSTEIPHRRNKDAKSKLIVVYIDLDSFKEINDKYGHTEGDEVLKKVAMRLRSLFRSDDLIFRIGGDEFITVLPLEETMDANSIVNRINDALASIKISSFKKGHSIELSYGIKTGGINNIKELIHEADLEMYKNKESKNVKG